MPDTIALAESMPGSLHIALATQSDPEWCARLMISTEPWITLQRDLEGARATLARPGTELFLARDDSGRPLGFILLAPCGFAASPYIACFAVANEARDHGIGSQLIAFAEQYFQGRGHLFLLVSSFNYRAQQFYSRHGYQPVGALEEYIVPGHSELIFHKRIP